MAKKEDKKTYYDMRIFLYLGKLKERLTAYANSDPRFKSRSACAVYLINLGIKHDKKDREAALESVK